MRLVGVDAEALAPVGLVVAEVPLPPPHLRVALEGEDVRRDAIEEPAVVADHHRATREREQRVLERPQRVDVEVVRRLVEEQDVAPAAQHPGQQHPVALPARELADLLLLVAALEAEARDVGAAVDLATADDESVDAAGDLLEHGAVPAEGLAGLVHVGQAGPRPRR